MLIGEQGTVIPLLIPRVRVVSAGTFSIPGPAGDVVGAPEVPFHLDEQIRIAIKGYMVIKSFLVIVVAAFHFPVMSGCAGMYLLMTDPELTAQGIQRVFPFGFYQVGELSPIIRLEDLWLIAEMSDRFFREVDGRVTALFHVRVDEAFPEGLV